MKIGVATQKVCGASAPLAAVGAGLEDGEAPLPTGRPVAFAVQ